MSNIDLGIKTIKTSCLYKIKCKNSTYTEMIKKKLNAKLF